MKASLAIFDNKLFDGSKTAVALGSYALVLGLGQMGILDPAIVQTVLRWLELIFGVGVAHKIDKFARGKETGTSE